jgi:S1-C subfamily serine protease
VLPKDDSGGTTILTNCHVIEAKDEAPYPAAMDYYKTNHDIEVTMLIQGLDRHRSASLKRTATLVEAHPDIDICVIATGMIIGGYSVGGIHPIEAIRSFTDLNPGERVFVIGNPKPGKQALTWSLTDGIISALRSENSVDKIQISAPIFHGNSGGALFDEYGNLIGITTEGYIERTQGFNFAIAADLIWARYGQ